MKSTIKLTARGTYADGVDVTKASKEALAAQNKYMLIHIVALVKNLTT